MAKDPEVIAKCLKRCADYDKACTGCEYIAKTYCTSRLMRDAMS